jgi:hypothetical protein
MNEYNEVSNQLDATTISFINLLNQPYMFRGTDSPILSSTFDCIHSFWCIVPKAVSTVKNAPEDGRICRPKHVGLI